MTTDVRYDSKTALIVVDMQNDFADPSGGLYVKDGESVVAVCNAHIDAARTGGSPVIYTQDWHPPVTPHFAKDGGLWPVHCVEDTWGAELHPALTVAADAPIVRKGVDGGDGYSGFSVRDPISGEESATELGRILEASGVSRLVVAGLAGDVCVKHTALDGRDRGYDVVVPLPATRMVEREPGDGERTVEELHAAGVEVIYPRAADA